MKTIDKVPNKSAVVCVRTADNRIDFVKGDAVVSAGFVKERVDKGYRWALVLNYSSPFYTKVTDMDEAMQVLAALYGEDGVSEAKAIVDKSTRKTFDGGGLA